MKLFYKFFVVFSVLAVCVCVLAHESYATDGRYGTETRLPIPRFATLKFDMVYVRTGPGTRYPIKWEFHRKNMPVQITREFGAWRRILDHEGQQGWIHQTQLSGKTYGRVIDGDPVYGGLLLKKKPSEDDVSLAIVEEGVIAEVEKCEDSWCLLSFDNEKGWLPQKNLWGVYESK